MSGRQGNGRVIIHNDTKGHGGWFSDGAKITITRVYGANNTMVMGTVKVGEMKALDYDSQVRHLKITCGDWPNFKAAYYMYPPAVGTQDVHLHIIQSQTEAKLESHSRVPGIN